MRQSNKSIALCLVLFSVITSQAWAQSQPATAKEVVEKAISALGGREEMLKVNNSYMEGRLDITSLNIHGTFKMYSERPNKFYAWFDVNSMGILEHGYNGTTYWEKNSSSGPRIYSGQELKMNALLAYFDMLYYDQIYKELKLKEPAKVNDETCQVVDMIAEDCFPITTYFSESTGLPVQQKLIMPSTFQQTRVTNTTVSYKDQNGHKVPYHMIQTVRGMETHRYIDHVEFNCELPKGIFQLPVEIMQLVKEQEAYDAEQDAYDAEAANEQN